MPLQPPLSPRLLATSDSSHYPPPPPQPPCLFWKVTGSLLSPGPSQQPSSNSIINKHLPNGCFVAEKYYQVSLGNGFQQGLLSEVRKKAEVVIVAIQKQREASELKSG